MHGFALIGLIMSSMAISSAPKQESEATQTRNIDAVKPAAKSSWSISKGIKALARIAIGSGILGLICNFGIIKPHNAICPIQEQSPAYLRILLSACVGIGAFWGYNNFDTQATNE